MKWELQIPKNNFVESVNKNETANTNQESKIHCESKLVICQASNGEL